MDKNISKLEVSRRKGENQAAMIENSVMSFLEKMASRGELVLNEQGVSLNQELAFFKQMINVYFDHIIENKTV